MISICYFEENLIKMLHGKLALEEHYCAEFFNVWYLVYMHTNLSVYAESCLASWIACILHLECADSIVPVCLSFRMSVPFVCFAVPGLQVERGVVMSWLYLRLILCDSFVSRCLVALNWAVPGMVVCTISLPSSVWRVRALWGMGRVSHVHTAGHHGAASSHSS